MNWFNEPVDIYCERVNPAFWAEPLNAFSNIAFILAGVLGLVLLRKQEVESRQITVLSILAIIVGIGSFTFHTIATKGAILADDIPIVLFIAYALYIIFIRVFELKPSASAFCVLCFTILNAIILKTFGMHFLNGSIMYLPTLVMLIFIAVMSMLKSQPFSRYLIISAGAFLLSIIFRSIDQKVCSIFPYGTHFLWHILNAVTMYYTIKALVTERAISKDIIL